MIYELRTYTTAPGKALHYLELFRTTGLPLVTRHLPMLGYWLSDVGPLNQIVHLWAYDDFNHRMRCRAGLAGETEWQRAFIEPAFTVIMSQESRFLSLHSESQRFSQLTGQRIREHPARPPSEPIFADNYCLISEHEGSAPASQDTALASFDVILGRALGNRITLIENVDVDAVLRDQPGGPDNTTLIRPLMCSPIGTSAAREQP